MGMNRKVKNQEVQKLPEIGSKRGSERRLRVMYGCPSSTLMSYFQIRKSGPGDSEEQQREEKWLVSNAKINGQKLDQATVPPGMIGQ